MCVGGEGRVFFVFCCCVYSLLRVLGIRVYTAMDIEMDIDGY